jgi:hypothetical protein
MADTFLLVVEGADDQHVMWAILDRHRFEPQFKIEDEKGYGNLYERLSRRLRPGTELERFGIIVDADKDLLARWQEIKGVLNRAGYADAPDRPDPDGTIVEHELLPRVGIWIMPDNVTPGSLEDFVAFLVPDGDSLWEQARRCLDEIPAEERRFAEIHFHKARVRTWLAWQVVPGIPMGKAIGRNFLKSEGPLITKLLARLTRLFA